MIYLDSSATTRPHKEVISTYQMVASDYWYNAHSSHKLGVIANSLIEQAQSVVFKSLNLSSNEKKVLFTKGGTEANNFAIYGVCNSYQEKNLKIITTKIEHPSVSSCFEDLEKQGFQVTYLDVDEDGIINLKQLEDELTTDTILISIQWVNNIIGVIQPIQKVIDLLKSYPRTKLHIDAIQGIGKVPFNFNPQDVDLISISAHKINGLKGAGLLIYQRNLDLNLPQKSSNKDFPGTIDVAGAVAMAKALQIAMRETSSHLEKVMSLHNYLKNEIAKNPNFIINGGKKNYSPYIFNFSIKGHNSETVMHFLEQYEIYVSTGSACSSKLKKPERTILAISHDETRALSSLRIGLSSENTLEEIQTLIQTLNLFCPIEQV